VTEQLTLWDDPKPEPPPAVDWDAKQRCEGCGRDVRRYDYMTGHGPIPGDEWGDCLSRRLRRNHVISFARAVSTRGVWPGRIRPKKWKPNQAWDDLEDAIRLARESGVTDDWITRVVLGELACGGRVYDPVIYRAVMSA